MARGNAMSNWFRRCAPCFTSEEYDRMSRSGGSSTTRTRTPSTSEGSTKSRGENTVSSSGEGDVASSSRGGGDVSRSSSVGGDVASSSRGGGDVASSSSSVGRDVASSSNTAEEGPMFWTRDLDRHYLGCFSTAVMQANINLEDYSQVEVGSKSTFVGVYDGHCGYEAAAHFRRNFTKHLIRRVTDTSTMSGDVLQYAFDITEQSWAEIVKARLADDTYISACGTGCLVGVIWGGNLHVANMLGHSRAILVCEVEGSDKIVVQQLTRNDYVRYPEVRAEVLQGEHQDEHDFIVEEEKAKGVYRIKDRIQVSRSIGDAYLKIPRFSLDTVDKRFALNTPVREDRPALSDIPVTSTRPIEPQDRFVIFASDGLWDLMSNQEVADFVHENPKEGIAARLITHALTNLAVTLGGSSHEDFQQYRRDDGQRRKIHDDISVVVIFFDHTNVQLDADIQEEFPKYSIREGSLSIEGDSNFTALDEIPLSPTIERTILIGNLPYKTTLFTLYEKFKICGSIEKLSLDQHGFCGKVMFYEPNAASTCIQIYQNLLVLEGKLVSLSHPWQKEYRIHFKVVHYITSLEALHYTVYVTNLPHNTAVESLGNFFLVRGLSLSQPPVINVGRNKRLYAYVTFQSAEHCQRALDLKGGRDYLGRGLIIYKRNMEGLKGNMLDQLQVVKDLLAGTEIEEFQMLSVKGGRNMVMLHQLEVAKTRIAGGRN